jgi:YD repeat-containing protein
MSRSNWTPEIGCLLLAGALAVHGEASAQQVIYRYDSLGRLFEVEYPGGLKTTYSYDAASNRVTVVTASSSPPPPPPPPPPPSGSSIIPWLMVIGD